MPNPWPLAWADLRRNRPGSAAIVLLVALAVALGVAVSAQERALRQGSANAADAFDILIGAPGSETQLVLSTVYLQPAAINLIDGRHLGDLAADPAVRFAAPLGFGDSWRGHPVVGSTADFVTHGGQMLPAEGRVFARIDEVVVGADVPLALGQTVTATHGHVETDEAEHHDELSYRVVGKLPHQGNPWDRAIVAPIEAVWWIHALPVGHRLDDTKVWPAGPHGEPDLDAIPIGPPWEAAELPGTPAIVVKPVSFAAAYGIRQRYRALPDTMAVFPAEVLVQLYALLGDVRDVVATISLLTQVLVIGAVLLAVLASLAQRRRLLGVLRALGASRGYIFACVWTGVALVLTVGALLGLAIGWLGAVVLSHAFERRTGIALPAAISGQELLLVAAIGVIGLLLAAVPAVLAFRGSAAAALRG